MKKKNEEQIMFSDGQILVLTIITLLGILFTIIYG
jgi:hypothetical protein